MKHLFITWDGEFREEIVDDLKKKRAYFLNTCLSSLMKVNEIYSYPWSLHISHVNAL